MGSLVLQMVVLLLVALLAGCYFNGLLVLLPAQKQLSASSYIEIEQANTRLGTIRYRLLIVVTLFAQLLLLLVIHNWSALLFQATVVSMLFILCATLVTVRLVVPLNRRVHIWSIQEPPAEWSRVRALWHRYHTWRTWLVLLAMLLQFAAVVLTR
jgi:predicted small lipoprotein YifL